MAGHDGPPLRPLTDAEGQRLQDGIILGVAVGFAGLGALVGGIVGSSQPALFDKGVASRLANRGAFLGGLLGAGLGAFQGNRIGALTLLVLEVHSLGDEDEIPDRPWRGW